VKAEERDHMANVRSQFYLHVPSLEGISTIPCSQFQISRTKWQYYLLPPTRIKVNLLRSSMGISLTILMNLKFRTITRLTCVQINGPYMESSAQHLENQVPVNVGTILTDLKYVQNKMDIVKCCLLKYTDFKGISSQVVQ